MVRLKGLAVKASRTFVARVLFKFLADDGPSHAIVIAWSALFSIFPIALVKAIYMSALVSLAVSVWSRQCTITSPV